MMSAVRRVFGGAITPMPLGRRAMSSNTRIWIFVAAGVVSLIIGIIVAVSIISKIP